MSGSVGLSEADFTDAERVDIRRFCGYPALGGSSAAQGWRYFDHYGVLEYRLNNMSPSERQVTRMMLSGLYLFEQGLVGSASNLDTDTAAVWRHNPDEVVDRYRLMTLWGQRLAAHIGVPYMQQKGSSNIQI